MPTLKEVPAEAEIPSHQLMLRAGLIRKTASGLYSYLPLGYRVIRKIENIVRDTMDAFGAQEILMSVIQPKEIWEESGRWATFGPEMFRLRDRGSREFALGPTAEEYFTMLIKGEINSYKQLPLNIYQIQTKFRDEKRPRFGLNRAREFLMKDAYSFDKDQEGLDEAFMNMWRAYVAVFDRLQLDYRVVSGDSGTMGGSRSNEFVALSEIGEGVITYCHDCDFAATDENAPVVYPNIIDEEEEPLEKVHTPGTKTIKEVAEFLGVEEARCAKALDFLVEGKPVIVFIPGDRTLNEAKLIGYLKAPEHEIEKMDEETIRSCGSAPGFTGPIDLSEGTRVIIDASLTRMKNLVVGANEEDHHMIHANFGRDFQGEVAEDLLTIEEGDVCPQCGGALSFARGIEVGHIFQLGTKYSETLNATFLDENGKEQFFQMGSYGIGVTRSASAIVEQNHDDDGIIWPTIVAPYEAIITIVNVRDEVQVELAERLYKELLAQGIETLLDDRKDRAGVKFADRDLIGIPHRITVGKKASENVVEYSFRRNKENIEMDAQTAVAHLVERVVEELQ